MFLPSSLPLVWALEFANPGLLAGLAATSIPIVIHLLNRRKFREMPWAAMQFLLAAIRKNQRRVRIEQWLLLAIRTLLIVLIVAAMAKPFLEAFGNVIAGQRTHRVLVLDGSLSMGYTSAGTSRFDQAKAVAGRLVKDSRQGDAISLILMGEPPRIVIGDPSNNLIEVQKEITELTMTHGAVDLQATFEKVDRVLEASTIAQKEIIFLTDLQETSWRRPSAAGKDGLDRILARIEARRPRSVVIDLGKPGSENRALTDLRIESPVVTMGATALIRGVIRNFGPSRADGVLVKLTVDGRVEPEQSVDLPVGEDVPIIFNHQFRTPGDHIVEVSTDNDPLPLDDYRWLAVPVRESLSVLLVDGHYKAEPYQAETDYLAQALDPTEGSPGQPSMIRVEVVAESQLSRRELGRNYDVVALCNVMQFSSAEVTALEDYLKQGGGVVIFGGDQVMADNYNRLLFAEGQGLLPAAIGPAIGNRSKREGAFAFDTLQFRHPLVAEFRNQSSPVMSGLTSVRLYEYQKLKLPKESEAQVALATENGDPVLIEKPRQRGKVIQVATTADADWTNWPLHNSYPAVMQQIVLQAAAGRLAERNIKVGQPLDQSFDAAAVSGSASVVTPRGQRVAVKLTASGSASQLHFEQTELSGPYQVRIEPPVAVERSFAANPDPAESDLAKLDRTALEQRLPGWNFVHMTNVSELTQSAASVGRRGELHRPLLYGALALLLLESLLAWKFGHHESPA
jgi:hypothetical protein